MWAYQVDGAGGLCQLSQYERFNSSDRTMSIQQPWCFFSLWSSCSSRPNQRRSCRVLLPPVAGCDAAEASPPPTTPTAGQGIPLLTHTPCYSAATAASHRSEPVNPRTPLRVGIHCHVFPGSVSSLALRRPLPRPHRCPDHRPGALGAAWSTWSRNGFYRTWTVRGEADSWVHGRSKEVPPYYVQNNYSYT